MFTAKAIIPKPYNDKAVAKSVRERVGRISKVIKEDFEETTETWDHDVAFYRRVWATHKTIGFVVNTADNIYRYVTEGTRPHVIRPKRAKTLRFWVGGYPKTRPGVLKPGSGAKGTKQVFAQEVHHPGTKARKFAQQIETKRGKWITKQLELAMNWGLQLTGHAWFPSEVGRR